MLAAIQVEISRLRGEETILMLNSGYRTPERNATIEGAARNSLHCKGCAADFWSPHVTNRAMRKLATKVIGAVGGRRYPEFHTSTRAARARWGSAPANVTVTHERATLMQIDGEHLFRYSTVDWRFSGIGPHVFGLDPLVVLTLPALLLGLAPRMADDVLRRRRLLLFPLPLCRHSDGSSQRCAMASLDADAPHPALPMGDLTLSNLTPDIIADRNWQDKPPCSSLDAAVRIAFRRPRPAR